MALLERITGPRDLRDLTNDQLVTLAQEIRASLIANVSRTGGHLGPNLGAVELTIALHRVFDSPRDPLIFDTGHQSYVHKMLTGRQHRFDTLRKPGGLSGYPSRAESEHDWVESSHASSALSWAEGMAKGFALKGEQRTVVAIVGDGSLTGGMTWEALNNISVEPDLRLVIVVNDNGRSYNPTIGGLATRLHGLGQQLSAIRTDRRYERALARIKRWVNRTPVVGEPAYDLMHGFKAGVKDVLAPQGMYSDLGIKYLGPIDGHDLKSLELAFEQAKQFDGGPVIVHAITQKGRGFAAAEQHEEDRFHAVGPIDQVTGEPLTTSSARTWTQAFGDELARIGATDDRVVAIYATFLNRAFDQLLMDVALHGEGVTFVLDRAGITGPDGASHHGMWDLALLGLVPGLRLAVPRDEQRLQEALQACVRIDDGPSAIRFSKDPLPAALPPVRHEDGLDVLVERGDPRVLVVGWGQFATMAVEVGNRLAQQGIGVRVVDPVWALPTPKALIAQAGAHDLVLTIEDGGLAGGLGSRLAQECRLAGVRADVREFGIPQRFIDHGTRAGILDDLGLTAQQLARLATETVLAGDPEPAPDQADQRG